VDRVAREVPETLLLAGFLADGRLFRPNTGMHRVYNSAFMHMMRDEDNAKYRMAIKNTLEFDPQILKRYVNFMNNPDERARSSNSAMEINISVFVFCFQHYPACQCLAMDKSRLP